jgi:hypothetical protein
MINLEELVICRKRGHAMVLSRIERWECCQACGMWVRSRSVVDEREEDPPEAERAPFRAGDRMVDREELAICRKRVHDALPLEKWHRCKACGIWVRCREVLEEQEEDPPERERGTDWRIEQLTKEVRQKLARRQESEGA